MKLHKYLTLETTGNIPKKKQLWKHLLNRVEFASGRIARGQQFNTLAEVFWRQFKIITVNKPTNAYLFAKNAYHIL